MGRASGQRSQGGTPRRGSIRGFRQASASGIDVTPSRRRFWTDDSHRGAGFELARLGPLLDETGERVSMNIRIAPERRTMGQWTAEQAATSLRRILAERGQARLVACTGSSQFEVLEHFTAAPDIAWEWVEVFHLDEYVGLPESHPA